MGKSGEATGSRPFSSLSTMPDCDGNSGGTIGVHDFLEELDKPYVEEKREDGKKTTEENDAKDGAERMDPYSLQMGLPNAEDMAFLSESPTRKHASF